MVAQTSELIEMRLIQTELGAYFDVVLLPSMTLHGLETDGDLLPDGI